LRSFTALLRPFQSGFWFAGNTFGLLSGASTTFEPRAQKEFRLTAMAAMVLPRLRYERAVAAAIVVLVGVRLICAALVPLSFDESDYWIWSKHIVGGYLDHPPINPILIRIGTTLFGDTEFGVRVIGVLLALPASWAIWRSAEILFDDEGIGATAALYFNLTLVMAAGSVIATPDNPLVVATTFLLLTLCKLWQTGRGAWWLAIGVAFGIGMLSKYTTVFFAVSILLWLLLARDLRRWLLTPWPWLAAVIAVAVFSPTLIWNAEHGWASVHYQSRRLISDEWSLRYLGELIATQMGMATPPIFVLGCMGLIGTLRGYGGAPAARTLVNVMVWPIAIYFVWHSLHGRVEGNWPEPLFVPFSVAAAVAVERIRWKGVWAALELWARRLAVPVGIAIAAGLYLQAVFAIVPLGGVDPTAQNLGAGWKDLANRLDRLRAELDAPVVVTTNQRLTGWLTFYLPSRPPVVQLNNRIRWVDAPAPDPALFRGTMMYICIYECADEEMGELRRRFATVEKVTTMARSRRGVPIETYAVYRLAGPIGSPLDPPDFEHFR
jgi:4-amino-4-deoxy-L-arabinose transferase-like glycosyltransferase